MKYAKKRLKTISIGNYLFIILIIAAIAWLIFFSGLITKNCKQDKSCFEKYALKCKKVKLLTVNDNNIYIYKIKGDKKDLCIVNIELKKMAIGTPINLVNKFEGKSMQCNIPKEIFQKNPLDKTENIAQYCSGPLKEAMYELIIEKMYGLIIKNFGDIVDDVKKDLYKIS